LATSREIGLGAGWRATATYRRVVPESGRPSIRMDAPERPSRRARSRSQRRGKLGGDPELASFARPADAHVGRVRVEDRLAVEVAWRRFRHHLRFRPEDEAFRGVVEAPRIGHERGDVLGPMPNAPPAESRA
jgi:hypothetical protein